MHGQSKRQTQEIRGELDVTAKKDILFSISIFCWLQEDGAEHRELQCPLLYLQIPTAGRCAR